MNETWPLHEVCCASLPIASLGAMAELRDVSGVAVALLDDRAWVHWQPGDESVLRAVLPVYGVSLYVRRAGTWYRQGHHLPAFDFPQRAEYRPLCQVVTPAPIRPIAGERRTIQSAVMTLALDSKPRPASALRCELAELAPWADTVPTASLEPILAARPDEHLLLMGQRLPPLVRGERFWGTTVLLPLGCRPEPDLPADAIREAFGIVDGELLLLDGTDAEVIPLSAFRPLTRGSVRLAADSLSGGDEPRRSSGG